MIRLHKTRTKNALMLKMSRVLRVRKRGAVWEDIQLHQ